MTAAFESFGRSAFGAFVKSPLGARGGGAWDLVLRNGLNYYTSDPTGATWTLHTIPGVTTRVLVGLDGKRVFLANRYTDDFVTLNSYNAAGLTTIGRIYKFPGYSRWWTTPASRIGYSDNNGLLWTERFGSGSIDPPVPAGHTYRAADGMGERIVRLSTGRMGIRVISTNAGSRYMSLAYSDDDGVTWTAGATAILLGASSGRVVLYQNADVFYMVSSVLGQVYSTNNGGASWTLVNSGVGTTDFDDDIWLQTSPRLLTASFQTAAAGNEKYSDDDFFTVNSISGLGAVYVKNRTDGKLYTVSAGGLLRKTADGVTWEDTTTDLPAATYNELMTPDSMYQ